MKRILFMILSLCVVLISTSCNIFQSPEESRMNPISASTLSNEVNVDKQIIDSYNQFGMELFNQISQEKKEENIFLSPYSISAALSIVYNGANSTTKDAMAEMLHIKGIDLKALNEANHSLKKKLENSDSKVTLNIANSLWYRENSNINMKEEFIKHNQDFYDGKVEGLDFSKSESMDIINEWVYNQTNGKIQKVGDSISPNVLLFIINAIYFQGDWTKPFLEHNTKEDHFYLSDGTIKKVKLMNQQGSFQYAEQENYQAIQLPYGDEKFNMMIILPKENIGLEKVQQQFLTNTNEWDIPFKELEGNIYLPSFQMKFDISLNDVLKDLGMEVAFDQNSADFSNMSETSSNQNLYISKVQHQSFIDVNENGTEAAAVTSVTVVFTSAIESSHLFEMKVNRPFFFVIQEQETDKKLFLGSVVDPTM
ncbi:serpin family protein [Chengkuizengella axinellae]|uniref:Serpin family protein n=1 Tax=Chengkuizengella axinellae TaxID=3064388 RepID=A0ABT9IYT3_9BACL|nr:serpin family protein [Chengkuizengella sp. 2205SS18-9]MDP5273960.1 serpin family protein [Chengkuizengella sp. 2205SS18-9]